MDLEKECGALGGLFQLIMNDMKASFPTWEDFITKGIKLQSQLRTTLSVTGAFLDAFQKVADMATGTRGATKDIGTALTRMCLRHRSIESKLKLFTTALSEGLIFPLEQRLDEWKRVANQLDKDHAKEYKKARAELKKKSSDTIKLQRKVKKGKGEARGQLDSALQDVNVRYVVLEETEKRAVCRALIEERSRYCSFVSMLKPVLDHEINMLGEVTHLQTIVEELTNLTAEPHKLPPASEQVLLDIKGSDFNYSYQTPPASPGSSLSRKSSISSNYQCGSVRHVPSLDSISADSLHLQQSAGLTSQQCLTDGGGAVSENGLLAPPHNTYSHPGERPRALSASGKSCTAREQLTLTLGSLQSDASRSSRDSLHCSSGYSTQTTTPSCSEDTIHSHILKKPLVHVDYESISLHGDAYSLSLHQLHQGLSQTDFDKSSTMPHNSDLAVQFRKFAQSKRPTSTVSLLADGETLGGSHTATIRRKPSSKPAYRRGTISGGVPIPILTPQVPLKAQLSHENLPGAPPVGVLGNNKLCSSTQSLSALPHGHPSANASQYYQLIPGQMPIPVPVPTIPENPQVKQQEFVKHFQEQQSQVHARPNRPPVTQQKPTQCQVQYQQQFYGESANMYQNDIPSHPQIPAPLPPQKQLGLTQPQRQQQYQQQNHPQNQTLPSSLSQAEGPGPQNQTLPSSLSQAEGPGPQNQTLPSSLSQAEGPGPQNQTLPSSLSQAEGPGPQKQTLPQLSTQNQVLEEVSLPGSMVSMIRQVKLRRTVTNDRSAPLLPPPINHK